MGDSEALIVVRTPNWLGDTVLALPALRALRVARPAARLSLIGRWAPLLAGQGAADVLLAYPRGFAERRRFARAIRGERPDLAVLLPNSFEAAAAAWRWGANRRLGFDTDLRRPLLTDPVPMPSPRPHQADEYAALLAGLDVAVTDATPRWTLPEDAAAEREVTELLVGAGVGSGAPLVGLHLGAAFGSSKLWPVEAFGNLAARLAAGGLQPLLLGSAADAATAAGVLNAAGLPVASLVGRDRPMLLARLLARLGCLVSGDTGVAHLAAALSVATVTLFGPTDPALTAPRSVKAQILEGRVPCAPCFLPVCPIDHGCLRGLLPEAVEACVRRAVRA